MTNMKTELKNFLKFMTEFTGTKINGVESIPTILWGNTYLTGFKVDDSENIMLKLKIIKNIDISILPLERIDYYMMNPDADFTMPYEFFNETIADEAIKEIIDKVMTLNSFDILYMEHDNKLKETIIEGIIFTSKRLACKEAMKYRKEYINNNFKMKFLQAGENKVNFTNFQIATMALD